MSALQQASEDQGKIFPELYDSSISIREGLTFANIYPNSLSHHERASRVFTLPVNDGNFRDDKLLIIFDPVPYQQGGLGYVTITVKHLRHRSGIVTGGRWPTVPYVFGSYDFNINSQNSNEFALFSYGLRIRQMSTKHTDAVTMSIVNATPCPLVLNNISGNQLGTATASTYEKNNSVNRTGSDVVQLEGILCGEGLPDATDSGKHYVTYYTDGFSIGGDLNHCIENNPGLNSISPTTTMTDGTPLNMLMSFDFTSGQDAFVIDASQNLQVDPTKNRLTYCEYDFNLNMRNSSGSLGGDKPFHARPLVFVRGFNGDNTTESWVAFDTNGFAFTDVDDYISDNSMESYGFDIRGASYLNDQLNVKGHFNIMDAGLTHASRVVFTLAFWYKNFSGSSPMTSISGIPGHVRFSQPEKSSRSTCLIGCVDLVESDHPVSIRVETSMNCAIQPKVTDFLYHTISPEETYDHPPEALVSNASLSDGPSA
jgi:hypothetical protein